MAKSPPGNTDSRFLAFLDAMDSGIAVYSSTDGERFIFEELNPAGAAMAATTPGAVKGREVREVFPGIEEMGLFDVFRRVWKSGEPEIYPTSLYKDRRITRWYENRVFRISGTEIATVYEDITNQKLMEIKNREQEDNFRLILETSQAGIIMGDPTGVITYANRRFADLLGYEPDEIIGTHYRQYIHPDDVSDSMKKLGQLIDGTITSLCNERRYLRKDGTVFWGYLSANRVEDESGVIRGLVGNIVDISDRKQAEENLVKTRASVEVASDSIFWITPGARIVDVNKAACDILGYTREELQQLSVADVDPNYTPEAWQRHFPELRANGTLRFESSHRTKDGREFPVEIVANYVNLGAKEFNCAFVRDISERRRIENELVEINRRLNDSEALYRTLFEQAPYGIQITGVDDTKASYFNTAMHRQLGYTREEYARLSVSDYEHLDSPEDIAARIAKLRAVGFVSFESVHRTKSGGLINVVVSLQTITIENQQRILATVRDVTEDKQIAQALRESEQLYRNLVETTGAIAWELELTSLKFTYISPQIETLLRYPLEKWTDFSYWAERVHPEDRGEAVAFCQSSTARGLDHCFEYRMVDAEGKTVWIRDVVSVICDGETPVMLRGFFIDVSDYKKTELALRESEERFRSIMSLSPDIISVISRDGSLIYNSPAALQIHGYTQEEMIGRNTLELIHPADREAVGTAFEKSLANSGQTVTVEYRYLNSDGSYAWMECRAINLLSNPLIKGILAISRNIDERKRLETEHQRLEQQLLHTQKLESMGVLAGGIAHDFNNILMAIIGNAELALRRINRESPAVDNLHRIEQAATRAADLARQMLAYSGKGRFVIESINLNSLLEEMLHMLEVSISKKVQLRLNLHRPLPSVEADATQMRQIIMNLVINASEAIGDKSGVIAVTTGCMECDRHYLKDVWLNDNISEGLYVYLEVADTGCGMNREVMARLFDPFFTTKFTGRGLGMSAVLGIVRGHKGTIKIYSEPDKGSTFKILLPASGRPAELFDDSCRHEQWHGQGTVLLVDDEETIRGIGFELLHELGFTPITAEDGRQALEIYRQTPGITAVILDLTMPHMDGEQCFRELRQINPDVKVIMSSGYNEQEVTQKFIGKGLAGFIQKPYNLSALKNALSRFSSANRHDLQKNATADDFQD